jgi:hypothetical protein
MPACTACGSIVEFVRTCYSGQWALFRNAPTVLTTGRYVRRPATTPHCPYPHNFWSSTWVANAYDPPDPPLLGERSGPKERKYFSGNGGIPIPTAIIFGDRDCITNGETYPNLSSGLVNGFNLNCFELFPPFNVSGSLQSKGQLDGKAFETPAGVFNGKGQVDGTGLAVELGAFQGKGALAGVGGTAVPGLLQGKGQLAGFAAKVTPIGEQGKGQLGGLGGVAVPGLLQGKGQLDGFAYSALVDGFGSKGGTNNVPSP